MAAPVQPRSTTLTATVISRILKARLGRQWTVGNRLPPVKQLARQLGTGQSNTHLAVRQLAAEGLLESRPRLGTFVVRVPDHDFHTTDTPGNLLANRTLTIFRGEILDGFVRRMVDAFRETLTPTGVKIRERHIPANWDTIPNYHTRADGDAIAIFNPGSFIPVDRTPEQLLTIISTTGRFHTDREQRYDLISIDELSGGALAGAALRNANCHNICFLGCRISPDSLRPDATSALRLVGFENAWGAGVDPNHILLAKGYSMQAGGKLYHHYRMIPDQRPDGVFAASDDLALGFMAAAAADGLTPGHHYQIVGFDGQDRGQSQGDVALTTVKVPAVEMGRRGAQLLLERFANPDRPIHRLQLECALHRGNTTHFHS